MINVTQTYLPPFEEYASVLKKAWDSKWMTNNGMLVQELELKIKEYLGIDNFLYCSNGTIVLQMALKALNITKEVITTPFSYVATANSILWEGCKPVFVDIDQATFCIDANKIQNAITPDTQAILATHVYGIPCDIEKIKSIAEENNLKVIYDAAHAFGCTYKGKSLLNYGDISTCSFHATKIFHTVEGGCIIANNNDLHNQLLLTRSFGHISDDYFTVGINAKNSELHAAMGLCTLPKLNELIEKRKELSYYYDLTLKSDVIYRPLLGKDIHYNYSYYPIVFQNEETLLKTRNLLLEKDISTRRYFFPSLNKLPFLATQSSCPVSESISERVLCLPLFYELKKSDIDRITSIIKTVI